MSGRPDTLLTPDQQLAMDYALGALDRESRKAVALRLISEPALRAEVERWQALLDPLNEETPPEPPPPGLWAAIMADIAPGRPPAPSAAPRRAGWWNSLALWRGLGLGGPVLAALATLALLPSPRAPAPVATDVKAPGTAGMLAATLSDSEGRPLLAATWDPLRGAVVLAPAPREDQRPEADKVAELWVIEGGRPPRSLGVIELDGPNAHAISSQAVSGLQPDAVLAISIEPSGGSPTGLPTGPVIATGTLRAI